MRTVVLDRAVFEGDVKPQEMLHEYRRLLAADMGRIAAGELADTACPGCRNKEAEPAFARFGMEYLCCRNCQSLYVSPRPSEEALVDFYRNADSARFWRETILPATREARTAKVYRPRAQWVLDVIDEYRPGPDNAIAVGYHNDLLIEELTRQDQHSFDILVTNAIADIEFADTQIPGVEVRPMSVDQLGGLAMTDVFLAFDVLDRCVDPELLFARAHEILAPGGLLLATTTLGSGFDIQVLWEHAEGVYPPERLNLLSVEGLTDLFQRHGFEALEFSTPGMFDVESVLHEMASQPEGELPRFIRYLMKNRGDEAREALQEFLQRFRLSSFGRIALRKTTA
jgi:hypothetical protein